MKKLARNKKIFFVLAISIVTLAIATSAAYMLMNILPSINNSQKIGTTTDKLVLSYTDCTDDNPYHCENINKDLSLGESVIKTFQIKNESKNKMTYSLFFKHLQNTFKGDELVYKIENIDTGEILLDTTPVPYREFKTANVLIKNKIVIQGNTTQNFKLTATFLDKNYNQSENLSAIYSMKLSIALDDAKLTEMISNEILQVPYNYTEGLWSFKGDVKKIVFEDTFSKKDDMIFTYDISTAHNESVLGCLVLDPEDNTKYILYIQSDGMTVANKNSSSLFYNFTSLETIENLANFNTNNVTDMSNLFSGCKNLMSLDLSNFNTSKVTSMNIMFSGCSRLETLDLSHFDTSNVKSMYNMFFNCSALRSLDISSFRTENVTSFNSMFYGCRSLETLDLSNFVTSKVTSMYAMFKDCSSLTFLDVSSFDTSNVVQMYSMFYNCSSLTSLDISKFDTSSVVQMYAMFKDCRSLTSLDVSHFDTSNVVSMDSLFYGCSQLTSLDVSNFDTSKATDMYTMFKDCFSLVNLDLSHFNTNKVKSMYNMFENCKNLEILDISNFDTSLVTDLSNLFNGCIKLTSLNMSNFVLNESAINSFTFHSVPESIKIKVKNQELKQWIISACTMPKLNDANFVLI